MQLLDRYEVAQESLNFRNAMIVAAIYNTVPRKSGKVYQPQDFMPGAEKRKQKEQQQRKQSEQDMRDTVIYLNKVFGGQDRREVSK